jgi:hypothetical protein
MGIDGFGNYFTFDKRFPVTLLSAKSDVCITADKQ